MDEAIVLGAGIGGLLAAAALAGNGARVRLVEKDPLPAPTDRPGPRKGVPQGPQVHAIMKRGEVAVEALLPGFREALVAVGGTPVAAGIGMKVYEGGGWHPQRDCGLVIHTQTRALLEQVIRGCLARFPEVEILDGRRFAELGVSADGFVEGVALRDGEKLSAPVVVDAMGRGSPLPAWLAANGWGEVPRERAGIDIHYVTILLHQPEAWRGRGNAWVVRATPPHNTRGATMMPIEGDRWLLTIVSRFGDHPPLDWPAILEFLQTIEGEAIHDLVRDCEVDTPARRFMVPEAILSRFDAMAGLPVGLLPLGDVIGNFNPVAAQGMTVAALHAEALGETLAAESDLAALARSYIARAVEISETAWQTSVYSDFAYPQTTGERPADLARRQHFRRAFRELLESDGELQRLAVHVQQLMLPSSVLARPDVIARAEAMARG